MTTQGASARKSVWKFLIPVAAIVLMVIAGLQLLKMRGGGAIEGSEDGAESVGEMKVGEQLPDFVLHQFNGPQSTASKLDGKVFLINFWATWCEACLVEMPSIIETRKMYKDKGFDVIAVNLDEQPDLAVPSALTELKIDFPVYVDAGGKLAQIFEVNTIPLTVIMDSNRKILMIHNGENDWNSADFRMELERWLQI